MVNSPTGAVGLMVPVSPGSFGDEALLRGGLAAVNDLQYPTLIVSATNESWARSLLWEGPTESLSCLFARRRIRRALLNLQELRVASAVGTFIQIGADMLDGRYSVHRSMARWTLMADLARRGVNVAVVSFSWNSKAHPLAIEAARSLPGTVKLFARDTFSAQRLSRDIDRNVETAADAAFLMSSGPANCALKRSGLALGVTVNEAQLRRVPRLLAEFRRLIANKVTRGWSVIMIPHDSRASSGNDDIRAAAEIVAELPGAVRSRIEIIRPGNAIDAKKAISGVDLLVTGRMHAGIAALSQGIPAVGLDYQDKFQGVFAHLGEESAVIPEGSVPGHLSAIVEDVSCDLEERRARIGALLPPVLELARMQFRAATLA